MIQNLVAEYWKPALLVLAGVLIVVWLRLKEEVDQNDDLFD